MQIHAISGCANAWRSYTRAQGGSGERACFAIHRSTSFRAPHSRHCVAYGEGTDRWSRASGRPRRSTACQRVVRDLSSVMANQWPSQKAPKSSSVVPSYLHLSDELRPAACATRCVAASRLSATSMTCAPSSTMQILLLEVESDDLGSSVLSSALFLLVWVEVVVGVVLATGVLERVLPAPCKP